MKVLANIILIDTSTSMSGDKISRAVSGVNELLDEPMDFDNIRYLSQLWTFSSTPSLVQNKMTALSKVEGFSTGGMTALYDTIGQAISGLPDGLDGGMLHIFTDGEENRSSKYTLPAVKKLIEKLRVNNWLVTYVGVDEGSLEQAESLGVGKDNSVFTKTGGEFSLEFGSVRNTRGVYTMAMSQDKSVDTVNLRGNSCTNTSCKNK